jgi:hypothetical protein
VTDGGRAAWCGQIVTRGGGHLLSSIGDQLGRGGCELVTRLDAVEEEGVVGCVL